MGYLLIAFGWLIFIALAGFCIAFLLDWIQDRRIPFIQRMDVVSMLSSMDSKMSKLAVQCETMRHELDSYEMNWVSVDAFSSLKKKVVDINDNAALNKAMRDHVRGLQRRVRLLEEAMDRISKEERNEI